MVKTIKKIKEERKQFFKDVETLTNLKVNDNDMRALDSLTHTNKKLKVLVEKYYKEYVPTYRVFDPTQEDACDKYISFNKKRDALFYIEKQMIDRQLFCLTKSKSRTSVMNCGEENEIFPCEVEVTSYLTLDADGVMKTYLYLETYGDTMSYDELWNEMNDNLNAF